MAAGARQYLEPLQKTAQKPRAAGLY